MLLVAIVGSLYLLDAHPLTRISDSSGLIDILFIPLVVTLAIGTGTLPSFLSTRVMVYLGHISFGLYMVHELVHTAWNWAVEQFELTLTPTWGAKLVVTGLVALAVGGAMVLYHLVEEPARRWMRRMLDKQPSSQGDRARGPQHGKVQQIGGAREARTEALSARAG